jgi:hypothetical protein
VTAVATLTIGLPLLVERIVLGVDFVPFAVTAAGALALYAIVLHAVRRDVMLDRLVADVRTPRRSRMAAAGHG